MSDEDRKITIEGRSNEPVITIRGTYDDGEGDYGTLEYELIGAELSVSERSPKFRIEARHDNGTDFEHDAAKVAVFEGVGLTLSHSYGTYIAFEGAIIKAYHYPKDQTFEPGTQMPHSRDDEEIRVCEDIKYYHPEGAEWPAGHLLMPYMPPMIKGFPVIENARIEISYHRFLKGKS